MKKLLAMLSILGVFAAYGCVEAEDDGEDVVTDDTAVEDTVVTDETTVPTDATATDATTTTDETTTPVVE